MASTAPATPSAAATVCMARAPPGMACTARVPRECTVPATPSGATECLELPPAIVAQAYPAPAPAVMAYQARPTVALQQCMPTTPVEAQACRASAAMGGRAAILPAPPPSACGPPATPRTAFT